MCACAHVCVCVRLCRSGLGLCGFVWACMCVCVWACTHACFFFIAYDLSALKSCVCFSLSRSMRIYF